MNSMGIGYMALWVFGAKCVTGLDGWMDTPKTVTTTRAPAVLIMDASELSLAWLP